MHLSHIIVIQIHLLLQDAFRTPPSNVMAASLLLFFLWRPPFDASLNLPTWMQHLAQIKL